MVHIQENWIKMWYMLGDGEPVVTNMPGYPHVKNVTLGNCAYVLKQLSGDWQRRSFLEQVYERLSSEKKVLIPLANRAGRYITEVSGKAFLLFEQVLPVGSPPSLNWWGRTLHALHSVSAFWQRQTLVITPMVRSCEEMLAAAELQMGHRVAGEVRSLLQRLPREERLPVQSVLNHGDPLSDNVMQRNDRFVLIDFDNARIFPKEYDWQRFLWGMAVNGGLTWKAFQQACGVDGPLCWKLMATLYILDFTTTVSWLYLVSNDCHRADRWRQAEERERFRSALEAGRIQAMVDLLFKESEKVENGLCEQS